ncbi:multiple sugar transport system permease protein [Streptomyces sp. DSM 42143]|uniref:carbohydrate ABC transporter permease n=1 Tax=Streptomyces TaxID=1883 RepID=UPI0025B60C24|nr:MULTISPECIES: sugar ABC transporter permease [unclassified Streptomyces]MDN3247604.1 sugar ABC transporter permease [Streptomyces sp. ZSW22]MDN3254066.1 sugar ABC transporter permease [Streptomyces sp. MA25(2023)]MDQ0383293.1 multiple sugar transport system permease protein [Streptomyces sp. DSM 42143]
MTTLTATPDSGERKARKKPPGAPRRSRSGRLRRISLPYLLLLPAILLELLVHLVPMVIGIVVSFKELTQFYIRDWSTAPWAAFDNYSLAVDFNAPVGEALLSSFLTTCLFTVLSVGLCWLLGVAAAIFMQESFRGRGFLRTLFLVPYALPVYAAVITWAFMFQRDNGLINHVVHDQLGLTDSAPFWLIGDNSFFALLIVSVWKGWPFAFLIVMAGLQNIPREIYEAAALDGAGVWQQVRRITLPALGPVNQVLVLVLFLWTFNDFNTPFVLFGEAAPEAADLISLHIYQSSFQTWNFGTGSAMSVLLLLFLLVVTGAYLWFTSRGRKATDA